MTNATTDRAAILVQTTQDWTCDVKALREAYPEESSFFTDDLAFARDAWENNVREPYFTCEGEDVEVSRGR